MRTDRIVQARDPRPRGFIDWHPAAVVWHLGDYDPSGKDAAFAELTALQARQLRGAA